MKVILGITGSIAAYKALELIRLLRKSDVEVKVVLTESATSFITPLSCQTLSDNDVYQEQFTIDKSMKHISLSEWGDILVIAPATANIIGKTAAGIGDDLLSTTLLSFAKPVLFIPAMDRDMWRNPIVSMNVRKLKELGYHFLEPGSGKLASGRIGKGRFPDINLVFKKIETVALKKKQVPGMRILITGGRTEEEIDPVRVVTNRSSGRMALEIYDAALCRDGDVRLILGEVGVGVPSYGQIFRVRTSSGMLEKIKEHIDWCNCLIMSAAVGDYRPRMSSKSKIHGEGIKLHLEKNKDILHTISPYKRNKIFVGFSLESKKNNQRARQKIATKKLDLIVLNTTAALGSDATDAVIINKMGKAIAGDIPTKRELAHRILDECFKILSSKQSR